MTTHYIYHIPGVKFGCTKNIKQRMYGYSDNIRKLIELYEELPDSTPKEAGDRERALNLQFGYPAGFHYVTSLAGNRNKFKPRRAFLNPQPLPDKATLRSRSEKGKKAVKPDQCPHCGLKNNRAILHRWHFDNCPDKPTQS